MFRFIACQQTLALSADKDESLVTLNNDFFRSVTDLADDDIEGVRIGVARFVGLVYGISTCISLMFFSYKTTRKPASSFTLYSNRIAGSYPSALTGSMSWGTIICTRGQSVIRQ